MKDHLLSKRVSVAIQKRLRQGWCRNALARDEHQSATRHSDPAAVQWCLVGAMHLECERLGIKNHNRIYETLDYWRSPPEAFNDATAKDVNDVIRFLQSITVPDKEKQPNQP